MSWHALLLTWILAAPPAAAGTANQPMRFEKVYGGHVTIKVPADWYRIPEEMLEFHSLKAAEASGGLTTEIYQHGFRPGNPELGFALPQILIQIKESGRLRDGRFLHLPETDDLRRQSEQRLSDLGSPLTRGLELGDAFYDREAHALHVVNLLNLEPEGEISIQSVSFLTERGLFIVHCYTNLSQIDLNGPFFERVIDSVRFDDELRYRPRLTDRWSNRFVTLLLAVAVVLMAVLAIVYAQHRRRRP